MSDREANTLQYHLYAESKKKGKKKGKYIQQKRNRFTEQGKKEVVVTS